MRAFTGATRICFLAFFASHIVASLIIDAQAILPASFIPSVLQDLLSWYAKALNDPLMSRPQDLLWFQSLIACELVFQVPFFFVACYYLTTMRNTTGAERHRPKAVSYPESFRYACIAYGAHTSTTMAPILATLATNPTATVMEKAMILAVYLPYLIFPLWILRLATRSSVRRSIADVAVSEKNLKNRNF
jgi:hypothetical protein